ncbi:MAG: hypothetical protein ACJ8AV_04080, partial [Gemmatimonadales bacterium]
LGGLDAEVGDGAEEVEELLVAGKKAHEETLGDEDRSGGKIAPKVRLASGIVLAESRPPSTFHDGHYVGSPQYQPN